MGRKSDGSAKPVASLFVAARGGIRRSVVILAARAMATACALVFIGRTVDLVIAGEPTTSAVVMVVGFLSATALLSYRIPVDVTDSSVRIEADLRSRLLGVVGVLGPRSSRQTGAVVSQATEGLAAVGALGGTFLPQLISGVVIPLLICCVIAVIDPMTGVVLVCIIPLVPLLLRGMEKRFVHVSARYRETADTITARFLDGVQGLGTIKNLDRAADYGEELSVESERLRSDTMALLRVNQLALFAVDTLFTLGTVVAAAGLAMWRLDTGAVTIGEAVAITLLGLALIEPMSQIGRFFYLGAIGRAAARQTRAILAMATPEGAPSTVSEKDGRVVLDGVTFGYDPESPVLRGVDIVIEPGERVALIGPSGAGKSTLVALVAGLLTPDAGEVRTGGEVVLVRQHPFLFHGTLRENLKLADPDATDDEMWAVLTAAELADEVASRPEGLDAPVGERGLQFSGGEVQRVAIARALLSGADIAVLDEPTSNIDLGAEARISDALDRLTAGRTVLTIAHRKSTIAGSDRVLVLGDGTVSERR